MKERRDEHVEEKTATPSTGNVFADLGLPEAEELLVKSTIAMKINQIIEKRHLSQTQAAAVLGIAQPKVSLIQQGKLRGFSLEKLCNLLTRGRAFPGDSRLACAAMGGRAPHFGGFRGAGM